jgi:hypothetical protein
MSKGEFSIEEIAARNREAGRCVERLRMAMLDGISETDVKEIIANLVARAKQGDRTALKFVFEYVLGGAKPLQMVNQKIVLKMPRQRTAAMQGTRRKLGVMQRRIAAGESCFHPRDGADGE